MKFWRNKKIVVAILMAGLIILGTRGIVLAQFGPGEGHMGDILTQTSADTAKQSGLLLNIGVGIATFCVTLLGAFINFSLKIGNNVIGLPIVQIGSQIVLNFANLGFVLAIIVIAFATIFRVQSYAMKQTLWKLIVAALLVNFSLVIAGAFINVSNIFTNFFLDRIQGGDLARGLMGVLNPQGLAETKIEDLSIARAIWGGISYFFKYIASLFFVLVFTFLIILTFFALFIMLLIRAIYLAMLLILMPIIWLLWIFPATSKHWQKWWSEFIRWNFFAPAMLFFIWLVIETGERMEDIRVAANINNAEIAAAFNRFLILQPDFIQHATQLVIITGLLMGGLFAANSLGITFASTAYGWVQRVGNWTGGVVRRGVGRTGLGIAGRTVGSERVKDWTKKLATKGPAGRFLARGLNRLGAKTEELIQKSYEEEIKSYTGDRLQTAILASSGARRAAYLNAAVTKEGRIDDRVKELLFSDAKTMEKIETEMKRAGYSPKGIHKIIGFNSEMLKADTPDKLESAANKLYDSFSTEDFNKLPPSALIDAKFGAVLTKNLLKRSAGSLSKIMPKIRSKKDLDKITEQINKSTKEIIDEAAAELDKIILSIDSSINIGAAGLMDIDKKLEWIKERNPSQFEIANKKWLYISKMIKAKEKGLYARFFEAYREEEDQKEKEERKDKKENKK